MGQTKKTIKGKTIFKHETEANWARSNYVPYLGEQVLYDPDSGCNYVRVKYGNGFNKVKDLPFDTDKASVVESLPTEKIPEFLDAFSKTDILHTYYAYNSPKDICIRLNYENGDFLIIWADYARGSFGGYIGEYSANGEVLSFWGSFSALDYYEELVNNYFDYNL